jgi:antitoxin ParD1/3/4
MASISLGDHFEKFAQDQITRGRYQNVSEVVRAGLRMLEDYEMARQERVQRLKARINDAWDDPGPSRPAAEVFDRIERIHAVAAPTSSRKRA